MRTAFKFTVLSFGIGTALPLMAFADGVQHNSPVTVVTLYSTSVSAFGEGAIAHPLVKQPIQVVAGGVKASPGTCFDLAANGELNPTAGECVVLRSASAH